jgi:uncharacterized membrane protein YfcA
MSAGVWLFAIALIAAAVNGGLGYGFSSITVPVALLFRSSRVLNPALVLVEVLVNGVSLWANRRFVKAVFARVRPMALGAIPGAALGSLVLAWAHPGWLKLFTFAVLLPFILLQIAGVRRPLRNERRGALPAGAALGLLYGATTVSGPPLALLFNNQGLSRDEFRASLAIFRVAESCCTAAAYVILGLITAESGQLFLSLLPAVLIGFPAGFLLLRLLPAEAFRRACMATDATLVGFGLAHSLIEQHLASPAVAWVGFAVLICAVAVLLGVNFKSAPAAEPA